MHKLLLIILTFMLATPPLHAQDLSTQLKQLARTAGFEIRGLNRLVPTLTVVKTNGAPLQQVRALLEKFDYVIVHGSQQKIQRLIIIGPKRPALPTPPELVNIPPNVPVNSPSAPNIEGQAGEITLTTQRDGVHHLINAILIGTNGQRINQELLIDTGASVTVIPSSQASALGLNLNQLSSRTVQTLKGPLQVKVGTLPILELGNMQIPNLSVAFAENNGLGQRGLLGMNLLSRYLFILDDERNELTLIPDPH